MRVALAAIPCVLWACGDRTGLSSLPLDGDVQDGTIGDADVPQSGGLCPLSPPIVGSSCTLAPLPNQDCAGMHDMPLTPYPCGSLANGPYTYPCFYSGLSGPNVSLGCDIDCKWVENAFPFARTGPCQRQSCEEGLTAAPIGECVQKGGTECCVCDLNTGFLASCAPCSPDSGFLGDCGS